MVAVDLINIRRLKELLARKHGVTDAIVSNESIAWLSFIQHLKVADGLHHQTT